MLIAFDLLDRQILDRTGEPYGKVDDVSLVVGPDGVPAVDALLVGQQALGRRIGGRLGRWMEAVARQLAPDRPGRPPGPIRIPYDLVEKVDSAVHLSVRIDQLPDRPLETFLRRHLVERIPGASHES
jgi:sporulation protein YlmC with PRC-barrel domain